MWEPIDQPNPNVKFDSPAIRKDLKSFGDKVRAVMCDGCCGGNSFVKKMKEKKPFQEFEKVFTKPYQDRFALKIKVNETGSLLLNEQMSHPFVRVHIVDVETGMYLKKTMPNPAWDGDGGGYAPGVWNKEAVSTMQLDPDQMD